VNFISLQKSWKGTSLWKSSGAASGSQQLLQRLIAESTCETEIRSSWIRVLLYPLLVLALAVAVLVFLAIVVVPVFEDIFDDFKLELPSLSEGVIFLSQQIRFHWLKLVTVIAIAIGLIYLLVQVMKRWPVAIEVLPYMTRGSSRELTAMAGFALRLAELVEAGLSLGGAIRLAGSGSRRVALRRTTERLAYYAEQDPAVMEGSPPARALPTTLIYALEGASSDGKPNVRLLRELAQVYTHLVRSRYDWTTGMVSQFAIVVVGLVVGLVILALLLPLVALLNGLTG